MDREPESPPPSAAAVPPLACAPAAPASVTLGDRLILALWLASGVALVRAVLQLVVDASADNERDLLLLEHFVEHIVDATGRSWWLVPLLAVLPRPRRLLPALLRGVAVTLAACAFLVGWPDGELRYTPGIDSLRGFQGWAAAIGVAVAIAAFDRLAGNPNCALFRLRPATRFVATAAVLLLGGACLAAVVVLLERRKEHLELQVIEVDLFDALTGARIVAAADGRRPVAGSLLAARGEVGVGGNRPSLVVPVGAGVEFDLDLPRHSHLLFSIGVDGGSIREQSPPAQRLDFVLTLDGRESVVASLRPQEREEDRRWLDHDVALTAAVEQRVRIGLSLRGDGAGLDRVRAGFGRPRIVRQEWRRRVTASPERMNVVVIAVDALRPDHLGCHGYGAPTTPTLDAMARDGVLYEQARSPATWAWPAVATLLTGLYPPTHGVDDLDRCFLSDSLETLPELLASRGCTTLCATANPLISRSKNFDQGFADWREYPLQPADRVVDQFADWIQRYGSWQFFAFLHLHDPHRPFHAPEVIATRFAPREHVAAMRTAVKELRRQRSRSRDPARAYGPVEAEADVLPQLPESSWIGLYDAEVRFVDEQIARVLTQLRKASLLDSTVVVVVGTHGETLALGPAPAAGSSLAKELRHVPLLIRDPRRPPQRVRELVDVTLLPATLAALAGAVEAGTEDATGAGSTLPVALPPWGASAPRFVYFQTARAELAGEDDAVELIGIEGGGATLITRGDGRVVEFIAPPDRPSRDGEERLKSLTSRLLRWHELARRDAVARPFDRLDAATRYALDELAESVEPVGSR